MSFLVDMLLQVSFGQRVRATNRKSNYIEEIRFYEANEFFA